MPLFNNNPQNKTEYLNFKNDKSTETDDYLFKMSAWNDLVSTLGGMVTSLASIIACLVIAFSDNDTQTKITAIAIIGGGGSLGGAAISRYDPKAGLRVQSSPISANYTQSLEIPTTNFSPQHNYNSHKTDVF